LKTILKFKIVYISKHLLFHMVEFHTFILSNTFTGRNKTNTLFNFNIVRIRSYVFHSDDTHVKLCVK